MRTNIELDEGIVEEAFRHSKAKTKKDLIHEALVEFVEQRKRKNLLDLKGKIRFTDDYNHKALREGR